MSINARLAYKYQVAFSNGRHSWVADEPLDLKGTDLGPSPYDLLLSSLAACKAMTARMYAERKGWPLTGMEINISHNRTKAKDVPQTDSTTGFVDLIDCDMVFHGELDQTQLERLREITEKCPVHRTIMGETLISSNLRS